MVKISLSLTSVFAIVDNNSITVLETLLRGDLGGHYQEMADELSVLGRGLRDAGETLAVLRDHEEVHRGHRVDVSKRKCL